MLRIFALFLIPLLCFASVDTASAQASARGLRENVDLIFVPNLTLHSEEVSSTPDIPFVGGSSDIEVLTSLVVSESPHAQAILDRIALKVFSSASAKNTFCRMIHSAEAVQSDFGISTPVSNSIFSECERSGLSLKVQSAHLRSEKVSRRFVLVQTSKPAPVESWTSVSGDVFIFLSGTPTEFEVSRALVHEYFIAYDDKSFFGSEALDQYASDPKMPVSREKFATREFHAVSEAFDAPLVSGTFQLIRALYFENVVLREMYSVRGGTVDQNCWRHVSRIASLVQPLQTIYRSAKVFGETSVSLKSFKEFDARVFAKLEKLERQIVGGEKLCRYLSQPTVGLTLHKFAAGPRPRIGSGTQRTAEAATSRDFPGELRGLQKSDLNLRAEEALKLQLPLSFSDPLRSPKLALPEILREQPARFQK